jgi:hypothetical protein
MMRQLIMVGATVVAALAINIGDAEAEAFVPLERPMTSSLPTSNVRYYRYPPPYYFRGRHSYVAPHCYNKDEIRELQRMWPETNWPRSMRCFPYR